ncbi:MAG: Glu/Leu/Phe/Val dehydrogenase [Flavobacteriaceae bacterium]|nr:leucine dehydrogenase [Bacteroidia bacterium]NNK88166.1 Glu/Leu/Phe/Val dehydrogenase [Flavobacteriaceae bacterium]
MSSNVVSTSELTKLDPVFGQFSYDDHEQVVFCHDKDTGLKAIIGVHSTVLGPALGGTRMWNYRTEWDALNDVLRLSRGMSFKAAVTGLDLGGGKAVIIGDSRRDKTKELLLKFGEFIHSLGGRYYTAEDVGMETADMDLIRDVTPYVTGTSESRGGAGNPSPITAYGVYMGMKAAARFKYGSDSLKGKKILVQGIGHVGEVLVDLVSKEDAVVTINDINRERLEHVSDKYQCKIFEGADIYDSEADIYAPCALGATINDDTVYRIKANVIAGAANNQLFDEYRHGNILRDRGIVYAPDFLINAGGIINVFSELEGYDKSVIKQKTENIFNTTLEILSHADKHGLSSHRSALQIAQERIARRKPSK